MARPMIMQDIVNKICPGGWCRGRGGEEVVEIPVRSVFLFFFFQAWSIREGHGKRRKGGNKSVATNMSVARLFIGARGRTGQACPSQDIVFEGWTRCSIVRYSRILERDKPMSRFF